MKKIFLDSNERSPIGDHIIDMGKYQEMGKGSRCSVHRNVPIVVTLRCRYMQTMLNVHALKLVIACKNILVMLQYMYNINSYLEIVISHFVWITLNNETSSDVPTYQKLFFNCPIRKAQEEIISYLLDYDVYTTTRFSNLHHLDIRSLNLTFRADPCFNIYKQVREMIKRLDCLERCVLHEKYTISRIHFLYIRHKLIKLYIFLLCNGWILPLIHIDTWKDIFRIRRITDN